MAIKPIETEDDYHEALTAIEGLMTAESDTPEGEKLDELAALIEDYESRQDPLDPPALEVGVGS